MRSGKMEAIRFIAILDKIRRLSQLRKLACIEHVRPYVCVCFHTLLPLAKCVILISHGCRQKYQYEVSSFLFRLMLGASKSVYIGSNIHCDMSLKENMKMRHRFSYTKREVQC